MTTMTANQSALTLEYIRASEAQEGRPFFRAITFQQDENGAYSVKDIAEIFGMDNAREFVRSSMRPTHYMAPRWGGPTAAMSSDDAWADAYQVLKRKMQELHREHTGSEDNRSGVEKLATQMDAHDAAVAERERLDAEREAEQERAKSEREERAAERADFDAWASMVRAARDDDSSAYSLSVTMRWAYNEVDGWEKRLAEHVAKVTENPVHALSWAGDFVQAAANFEVAKHLVDLFEAGVSAADMEDEIMRAMFNKADRAVSRSTSVMSNLTDDCVRVAYTEAAKRITGRSFW
ncbi:MAG TPA: hypothetical protein VIG24_13050 [Acidimicrobiia bacterium]